jgi:predicted chitinase
MKIELQNFFRYYNHELPKHRAAVDDLVRLLEEKAPELLDDSSNWIRIYRSPTVSPPTESGDILLNVPWYKQTDNYTLADETCNSSACATYLEFMIPGSLPPGVKGDDAYLKKVLSLGKSTDHSVQTRVLDSYGLSTVFRYNLSFEDLDRELEAGRPMVIGILHRGPESAPTGSGHIITVIGRKSNGDYIVHDPYGNLYDGYTTSSENGKAVVYRKETLRRRWTVKNPNDGWGRVFLAVKPKINSTTNYITKTQLAYIWGVGEASISDKQIVELNDCLRTFEIITKPRIQHFISQCSHESGAGEWMQELASGQAYEGRTDLGNVQKGDGPKFKGAGYIQLTGRYNYQKFSDFIKDPKVMEGVSYVSVRYPATASGFWWMNNKMNRLCDSGATCRQVSAIVNGRDPANGLADREKYYKRCIEVIK